MPQHDHDEDPDARWQDRAECRGMGPELFYPTRGEPLAQVRAVCASCPVREPCLEAAYDRRETWGIWGGLSERERRLERRARRQRQTA